MHHTWDDIAQKKLQTNDDVKLNRALISHPQIPTANPDHL